MQFDVSNEPNFRFVYAVLNIHSIFFYHAGPKAFPDNQIAEAFVGKLKERNLCKNHQQPVILFCDEPECQIAICALCIPEDHVQHKVIKIESKVVKKSNLQIAKELREKITHRRRVMDQADEDVNRIGKEALAALDERYKELGRQLLDLHKDVRHDIVRWMVSSSVRVQKGERKFKEGEDNLTTLIDDWENVSDPEHCAVLAEIESAEQLLGLNESGEFDDAESTHYLMPMMSVVNYEVGKTNLYENNFKKSLFGTVGTKWVDLPEIPVDPSSKETCSEAQLKDSAETVSQNSGSQESLDQSDATASNDEQEPKIDEYQMEWIQLELHRLFVMDDVQSLISFDWIEFNVRKEWRNDLVFVSSLMENLCRSCIIYPSASDSGEFEIDRLKLLGHIAGLKRTCLTCTSCSNKGIWGKKLQKHVILAVQKAIELANPLNPPKNLTGQITNTLFDESIINLDGLNAWMEHVSEKHISESDYDADNDSFDCDFESDFSY